MRYHDTFLLVGGFSGGNGGELDKILQYNPSNGTWSELPGKLKKARMGHTAILVDRSVFPTCP